MMVKKDSSISLLNDLSTLASTHKQLLGLLFALLSGLTFTISNFMVQLTIQLNTASRIPTMEVVFCRTFIQLIFVITVVLVKQTPLCVSREHLFSLICMGLSGYFSIVLVYLSLDKIPLSDTLVITFTSPFFCVLFSKLILKEKVHWFDVFCGLISFIGIVIVARPSCIFGKAESTTVLFQSRYDSNSTKEAVYLIGVLFALVGGACLALYFVLTRQFSSKGNQLITIFYPSLFGTILSPLSMPLDHELFIIPQSMLPALTMCSVGITGFFALAFLSMSLKLQDAGFVSLIRNLDIVYAFILQYLVFDIKPTKWNISGGLIIVLATSLMSIRKANMIYLCSSKKNTKTIDDDTYLKPNNMEITEEEDATEDTTLLLSE